MKHQELADRTKAFALRVIRVVASLPRTREASVLAKQLLEAGTSVGANYREARRARRKAEFAAKVGICLQEADETAYWLELLGESAVDDGRGHPPGLVLAGLAELLLDLPSLAAGGGLAGQRRRREDVLHRGRYPLARLARQFAGLP